MITVNPRACTGCRDCVKVCPHAVLAMHQKKVVMLAEERCIECGACQLNCHHGAIEVTKGTGCLLVIIRDDILRRGDRGPALATSTGV
jgi:NAD-dependent dihydropyrimidine dehydrogenase PreA subunit